MRFSFKRKRTKKVRPISNVRKNLIFVKAKPNVVEPPKSEEIPVVEEVAVTPIGLAQPLQSEPTEKIVEEKAEVSPVATEQVADTEEVTSKPKSKKRTTKASAVKTSAGSKEEK